MTADDPAPGTETDTEAPAEAAGVEETPRHRLHPFSPVLHGVKTLWVVIAAISWQGFARFGVDVGALIVLGVGVLGLVWATLTWFYTGYQLHDGQLRITTGVLIRSHRTIPLERLQSVEVRQPLLARLVGLADLRMEVTGGTKTEAPLAYLPLPAAERLRTTLLNLSRRLPEATTEDDEAQDTPTEPDDPALVVATRDLVVSQMLSSQLVVVPVAAAVTVALFVWEPDMSFFGLAGLITATAGTLLQPIARAAGNYDFRLYPSADSLRIRRGLTERRTQTVPLHRITAVVVRWPRLWRWKGWVQVRAANAGHSGDGPEEKTSGAFLLPVGDLAQARGVASTALSGPDVLAVPLAPAPKRASWCAPVGRPALGMGLTEDLFVCRSGRISPTLVAVPLARIQSVRVTQGRRQRWLRLATVHVDIAGGLTLPTRAKHRDVGEALTTARRIREATRR
ncbi:putative membrane protein [Stackebrandtia albiflava]|uniref:Putative membrane protein n=1 Tax=Stackebrandtia albiflava TaxID=406432 RepID=A0A562VEB5_9ACTN|nr:PH domain-containing protein [Stackebrandtia albiflava]TWJ16229.1 putative membrane protein [Stackebrandtia albiflava]